MRFLTRAVLLAALSAGCQDAPPAWLVLVTTDATIPTYGDRLLAEVIDSAGNLACPGCRREFQVPDNASFPLSFGVAPPPGTLDPHLRVRARLYRGSLVGADGLPRASPVIDGVSTLPELGTIENPLRGVMVLERLCVDQPADVAAHRSCQLTKHEDGEYRADLAPDVGIFTEKILESFYPGYDPIGFDHCADAPSPPGMACVKADAFILGSWSSVGVDSDWPPQPERVMQAGCSVQLDLDEMTVGAVRKLVRGGLSESGILRKGSANVPESCTWLGANDGANDALPINCISVLAARAVCRALNKRLPDEGVWERAAKNGLENTRHPWGDRPPTCADTIVSVDASCLRAGPVQGGSPLDVNAAGIRNLGGNLSEWIDGVLVDYGHECWSDAIDYNSCGTLTENPSYGGPWPHRGGAWNRRASSAVSFARFASAKGDPSPSIGFRCALNVKTTDTCPFSE
jgi:formylglycine-generating enzyme